MNRSERKKVRAELERCGREMAETMFPIAAVAAPQDGTQFVICAKRDDLGDQEVIKTSPGTAIMLAGSRRFP
jgi:hypothetical protein